MSTDPLDRATVLDLARLAGLPLEDASLAARIAVGASAAIAAVASQVGVTLFDLEPGDYLATLERLAEAGPVDAPAAPGGGEAGAGTDGVGGPS